MRPIVTAMALLALAAGAAHAQGMLDSKHNLSVSGPGPVKAVSETQVCVFCHTPHNASPAAPLWNRTLSGQTYAPYASGSAQAAVGQPNGYSRLCLSCHDGTIAIGQVHNLLGQSATINMTGTGAGGVMPAGPGLIGVDLSNDHPVSFVYSDALAAADGELAAPSTLTGLVRLYEGANPGIRDSLQCTTCHDAHSIVNPKFLKKAFTGRADNLCLTCHTKPGWVNSSHESATAKFLQGTAVSELSCGACHAPHADQGAPWLLRGASAPTQPAIEAACYRCHRPAGQGGLSFDLQTQFAKTGSLHRVTAYTGHAPVFTVAGPPEAVLNTTKHVECTDCHNPHRVRARGTAGTGGVYEGMRGIRLDGTVRNDVTTSDNLLEHEICLRCHGDTYATAVGTTMPADPSGSLPTSNKRTELQTSNSAYHPVAGVGRNTSQNLNDQLSPKGLSVSSVIRCTDCHNNDFYSGAAYQGVVSQYPRNEVQPKGPHGSTRLNLLRARYWNALPGPASWLSTNFDLCFHCHDLNRLTARRTGDGARTNFYDSINGKDNLHWLHLIDRVSKAQATCRSCHFNIHSNVEASNTQYNVNGVVSTSPNLTGIPTRLISFHPNVRPIGTRSRPEWWINTTTRERRCYLVCHSAAGGVGGGAQMNGLQYRPSSGDLP